MVQIGQQFGFQMPTYGKKKEEEQFMSKIPTGGNTPVSPVSKQVSKAPMEQQPKSEPLRKPMMSYDIQGTILPGVSDETAVNIQNYVKTNAKTPEEEKLMLSDLHQEAVKVSQIKKYQEERTNNKADMVKMSMSAKDPEEKKQIDLSLKLSNISDIIREGAVKEGYNDVWDMDDKQVIDMFVSGNTGQEQIITDYMNGKLSNVDFGKKLGVIQEEQQVEEDKGQFQSFTDVTAGSLASATGLPRFVAGLIADYAAGEAKRTGVRDPKKIDELVANYKQSISEDQLAKEMGADQESLAYGGTKMAGDIIQTANPAGLGGIGNAMGAKAGQIGAKLGGKLGNIAGKIANVGTQGAVDTALFMPVSENRMATGKEIALGAAVGGALPILGAGLNYAKKGISKIAPKLELSGIINPAKLNTVKEKLIQEGVNKADSLDVGKWMLNRGIKGNKEQIIKQLDNISTQSKKAVDDTLSKSTTLFKNNTADDLLGKLSQEYDGSIAQAGRDKYNKIQGLIQKSKNEGLSLTELNDVKRMIWDLDPFSATGKVKVSKADLAGANSELKNFIEREASNTIEGVDKNMIKMLNNETQIAKGLSEGIAKKEGADAVREIVNFMAGRSPGAIVGGTVGYQQGGDWKSTIGGALLGGLVGSTSMKTKAANLLYKTFSKQEQTILQKFIQSGGVGKLSSKITDKLDNISNEIKQISLQPKQQNVSNNMSVVNSNTANNMKTKRLAPKLPIKNEKIDRPVVRVKAPEVDTSYRIGHQIDIKKSSPITSIDTNKIDVFIDEFKKQYGYPALKSKDVNKFKQIMNNPEGEVTIYRASPKNELNKGDWVTIDKEYANDIKRQNGGKVYSYKVKAKELLYPNTIEGFNELPSLNKRGAFQYNK